jgi:alpha-N-arabinofuranosidase
VAGLNFHIFQRHADRVVMANIAQLVNVLQSLVLTDGPKMTVTPTYHVFEMFKVHQDATALPVDVQTPAYTFGGDSIPAVSASASRDQAGRIHLSLVNANPRQGVHLSCSLAGRSFGAVTGRVLTADTMQAHNTFDQPDAVKPAPFTAFTVSAGSLAVDLPSKSVVVLELE